MILINGESREFLPATDRGLHYGDGLFETIAVHNGRAQLWDVHMERLLEGCTRLGIPLPDIEVLAAETSRLCANQKRAVIKIIITRGSGGRGYRPPEQPTPQRLVMRFPWPDYPDVTSGITLRLCSTPLSCNPALAGIKHLNRLEQVLARNEWNDDAVPEGLMLDGEGYVIEGTMSNLFAVRDGVLLTPDLERCGVAGVMRRQVLALARELDIACELVRLRAGELNTMDEVFVTNSLIGIWPVSRLEQASYAVGPVTRRLMGALDSAMGQA